MWKALHPLYNLYRRWFGTYTLDDPRPIQKEAPYTFFLPAESELASVRPGDLVKLIFRSHPAGVKFDAERMWVEVTEVSTTGLRGRLDNNPSDIPQLKPDAIIEFQPLHIIATDLSAHPEDDVPAARAYWERCLVDACVLDDKVPVYYIYREEPDAPGPDDRFPDSGWRIRGDYRGLSDEQIEGRKTCYIALGKILNADDSWIRLIDSPAGSAFMRNFETGEYQPAQ